MLPLFDLTTQYRSIREEIRTAVDQVLDNAHYILGWDVSLALYGRVALGLPPETML